MMYWLIFQFLTSLDSTKESAQSSTGRPSGEGAWSPYTLGWLYLTALLATSLVLLAVLIYLHVYSRKHHGLSDYSGQSAQFFAWRFAPTLVATLYAFRFTMLLDDVKRTEPYVRLARLTGGSADSTVLNEPGAWWNALIDDFSRTKNGGARSWPLVLSATCLVIALGVISHFHLHFSSRWKLHSLLTPISTEWPCPGSHRWSWEITLFHAFVRSVTDYRISQHRLGLRTNLPCCPSGRRHCQMHYWVYYWGHLLRSGVPKLRSSSLSWYASLSVSVRGA